MAAGISKRRITFWVVVLLAALSLWLQQKEDQPLQEQQEDAELVMDYSLSDFDITEMNEKGLPRHRLQGASMTHFAETDYAELVRPHLEIYRDLGGQMSLDAEMAMVYQGGESVLLQGAVKMLRQNQDDPNELEVLTSDVWFYADQEIAETSESVTIKDNVGVTTAKGMRIDTRSGSLHLLASVRGKYVLE